MKKQILINTFTIDTWDMDSDPAKQTFKVYDGRKYLTVLIILDFEDWNVKFIGKWNKKKGTDFQTFVMNHYNDIIQNDNRKKEGEAWVNFLDDIGLDELLEVVELV